MSVKKYFKFDEIDQFLEDQTDINYYSSNQVRRVAVGNMLGDYNEQGLYVLDENLIKELVNMPKVIVDSVGGADLIRSAIKFDSYIHFMLTIEEDKACLILLEKVNFESNVKYNAGSYTNMNEYVLEEVKIPDRDVDRNVVYTKFNISREDEGKYYDYQDLTAEELLPFDGIIKKIKYNFLVQNLMISKEKEIETIEADYFDNVLNAFSEFKDIKKEFEKLLKELIVSKQNFLIINKPFFAKTINELLDNCLSVFLLKLPPEVREKIEQKIREAKAKYFQAYNLIIHMQFIENQNAVIQQSDNMIGELSNSKVEEIAKVTRYEINEKELEKSFYAIIEENSKLKKERTHENSGEEVMRLDNPILSKFFDEIKKEFGIDMLKNKEAVAKKVDELITKEIAKKKEEKQVKQEDKEKKSEPKKEENTQDNKTKPKKETDKEKKVEPKTVNTQTAKRTKTAQSTTTQSTSNSSLLKKATNTSSVAGSLSNNSSSKKTIATKISANTQTSNSQLSVDSNITDQLGL